MVNIYETEGGKLNALQDFEEGCWVKVTAATMWEMEPVAKKYNIDIEDMRAALDEEEKSRIVLEDDYTLVLVDIPASEIQHEKKVYTTIPLGLILADGAIITICSEDTPILNTFIKSHVRYFSTKKRTRFVYQILLNSMTTYQNVLRSVDNRRLAIEARIWSLHWSILRLLSVQQAWLLTGFADISIFRSSRKMKIYLRMYRSRTDRLLRWRRFIERLSMVPVN